MDEAATLLVNDVADTAMPVFHADAARDFSMSDDRDVAAFFAGRGAERQAFDAAVRHAHRPAADGTGPRALFRVIQGAPGSGKTSFVLRMIADRWSVAVPSMAAWAAETIGRTGGGAGEAASLS